MNKDNKIQDILECTGFEANHKRSNYYFQSLYLLCYPFSSSTSNIFVVPLYDYASFMCFFWYGQPSCTRPFFKPCVFVTLSFIQVFPLLTFKILDSKAQSRYHKQNTIAARSICKCPNVWRCASSYILISTLQRLNLLTRRLGVLKLVMFVCWLGNGQVQTWVLQSK